MKPTRDSTTVPPNSTDSVPNEKIIVRGLTPEDLQRMVALDARITGRRREEFFGLKLRESLQDTGVRVSLAAEIDGAFCGFLLGRVHYGEFGVMEPVAMLDTIGVHPDFRGQGIGGALLRQIRMNLKALGVARLRTEVSWDEQDLLAWFHGEGFRPADRFCLDLTL
jgi:ribosomal protein S18 acetylase RimI-like enzyme